MVTSPAWTPTTHEDMDACRGRPELLGALTYLVRRSLARRDGILPRHAPGMVAALAAYAGVSERTAGRWIVDLEDRGVYVHRDPGGRVEWITTRTLRRFDRADPAKDGTPTPMSGSTPTPMSGSEALTGGGPRHPRRGDPDTHVGVAPYSSTSDPSLQNREEFRGAEDPDTRVRVGSGEDDARGPCAEAAPAGGQTRSPEGFEGRAAPRSGSHPTAARRRSSSTGAAPAGGVPVPQRREGEPHGAYMERLGAVLDAHAARGRARAGAAG